MKRDSQRGSVLLAVVLALSLIGAVALLLNRGGSMNLQSSAGQETADVARAAAEAALNHAIWQAQQSNCVNYVNFADQPFGSPAYQTAFSPVYTTSITPLFGSPVLVKAKGVLQKSGTTRELSRRVRVYEASTTVILQLGTDPGKDAMLDDFYPVRNYGGADYLQITESGSWLQQPVLQFDLTGIPAGVTILSAKLELKHQSTQTPGMASIHRLTRDWVEGTKAGGGSADGANWPTHDGTNSWTTAGGDFDATPIVSVQVTSATHNDWLAWEIGPLVEDWVAGKTPNYGLLIKSDGPMYKANFASREASNPADAPKLTITYSCECGFLASNTLVLQPGAEGTDSYVQKKTNDTNKGGFPDLFVDTTYDATNSNLTLLGFDVSGIPAGAVVNSAQLSLYGYDVDAGIGGADITLHRMLEPWTENGVTYQFSDGTTPWAWPANFEPVPESNTIFFKDNLGWHTWDMTDLVIKWLTGVFPNNGLVLHGTSLVYWAAFHSSDYTDPTLRPKLTVSYNCPCGVDCSAGTPGPPDVLFVVGDATTLASKDGGRKTLMESWGYSVTLIDDGALQADFDTAAAAADVVYVSGTIGGGTLGDKLTGSPTGIVNEFYGKLDNFGFCSSTGTSVPSADTYTKTDPAHFITEPFSGNPVTVFTTTLSMSVPSGTLAPDLQTVGQVSGQLALVTLDTGATRWDGNPAPGRRVHLQYSSAEAGNLTGDGETILQRALRWAGGEGAGAGGGGPLTVTLNSVADTYIDQNSPASVYGSDPTMTTGANNSWELYRTLVRFDVSTIPAGATVSAASLRHYIESATGHVDSDIGVYAITAPWDEATATWSSEAGGAFDPAQELAVTLVPWNAGWVEWTLPVGLIHEWVDGITDNDGLLLNYQGTKKNQQAIFASREEGTINIHPQLVIEYTEP